MAVSHPIEPETSGAPADRPVDVHKTRGHPLLEFRMGRGQNHGRTERCSCRRVRVRENPRNHPWPRQCRCRCQTGRSGAVDRADLALHVHARDAQARRTGPQRTWRRDGETRQDRPGLAGLPSRNGIPLILILPEIPSGDGRFTLHAIAALFLGRSKDMSATRRVRQCS